MTDTHAERYGVKLTPSGFYVVNLKTGVQVDGVFRGRHEARKAAEAWNRSDQGREA